jgi:hypothetical protein
LPFLLDVLLPPTLHPLRIPAQIVTPVLYQMWTGRSNVTRVGLIHLCTFLLLLLSGNRAFGVGLNKLFSGNLPADFPAFEGSHADLLVLVLHKLIVDGSPKLSTLYSCFLTIIANVSSYTKVRTAAAAWHTPAPAVKTSLRYLLHDPSPRDPKLSPPAHPAPRWTRTGTAPGC